MKKLILFLLIAHFLKELVWASIIPIWHFPDEEQHFSYAAFFAEKGYFPENRGEFEDVNIEIDKSSEILGTKRNTQGVNKFTYHPEYRIPYTKDETGLFEEDIRKLNTQENRKTMVKREAARYGPVYYVFGALLYKLVFAKDIFFRVIAVRLSSIILSTLTVLTCFLIAKEVFEKKLMIIAVPFLVSFMPMFSFVSAGVNSDNLFNLIFSLIILFLIKLFFKGKKLLEKENILPSVGLTAAFLAGFYTKEQIYISVPIILFAFLLGFAKHSKKERKKELLVLGLMVVLGYFLLGKRGIPEYDPNGTNKLNDPFFVYIFWHLTHTVAETIPWYWGVFNWLGVTLPSWVNKVQARLLIVSLLGVIVYFVRQMRKKKTLAKNNLKILFLFGSSLIYYFAIIVWDYFFRRGHTFSFGIQGRYFFPTIAAHMVFIVLGLASLLPKKLKRFRPYVLKILMLWWFAFSIIGLLRAAGSYYQLLPFYTFLDQASQYKPYFLKGWRMAVLIIGAFAVNLGYIINILTKNEKNIWKNN